MIRAKQQRPMIIDLTGPQGNAFFLLGTAQRLAKQLDLNGPAILTEMKSGDYEHLIEVFEQHFGEYVILER
jgi:hypothetical protein